MDRGLAGHWRAQIAGREQELEISPTGEARLVGAPYLLVVLEGALVVPQFGLTYPFALTGDTLTLEIDGVATAFTRA